MQERDTVQENILQLAIMPVTDPITNCPQQQPFFSR